MNAKNHSHGSSQATKKDRGLRSYLAGLAAESAVADAYKQRGCKLVAARWRGQAGEIDLIFQDGETYIFVEVKKASSFELAASRLSLTQLRRIHASASEYLAHVPDGQLSDVRLDLALCDARGAVQIHEGALSHF